MTRREASAAPGSAAWLVALPALPLAAALFGLAWGLPADKLEMLCLAGLTGALALAPALLERRRPLQRRRFLGPMLALWVAGMFVAPVFTNYLPAPGLALPGSMEAVPVTSADVIRGQRIALLGLAALLLGYALPAGRALARALPAARHDWPRPTLLLVAATMLAAGAGLRAAGLLGLVPAQLGTGALGALESALVYAPVLLAIACWRHRDRTAAALLGVVVIATSALGFLSGSKQAVLAPWALVAVAFMILQGRIRLRWIALGFLALALIYPTMIFHREVVLRDNTLTTRHALRDLDGTLERVGAFAAGQGFSAHLGAGLEAAAARIDGLGVTSVLVRDTPALAPFQHGRTLGLFFVAFVPRALWPEKPSISIGRWIKETYTPGGPVASNIAPTAIGDFYLNFGALGVLLGMAFLGGVLRTADEALLARRRTAPALLAAVVILYQGVLNFERNVAMAWGNAVFALVPLLLAHAGLRALGLTRRVSTREPQARRALASRGAEAPG